MSIHVSFEIIVGGWQTWNDFLRNMPFEGTSAGDRIKDKISKEGKQITLVNPENRYATSILTLVSAIVKLSRTAGIPPGRKVSRGLGSMKLDKSWFVKNQRGVISGVELGFMSTTLDRKVAMQYSGIEYKKAGTIMVFQVGAVDLGARLGTMSQYPGNGKYCS